ncbi:hypothetical protein [Kitasatospora sp. NPDC088548]|uniref:hypothetical protein n=1 Tax=Kitasatospora sp. NPDC088548 TaxID=3364075 RepID=UPI0037FF0BF5
MAEGRRADTGRRRQRVQTALAAAAKEGTEISVTAIARRAGVDHTFLYRHRDLLGQVHAQSAEPPTVPGGRGPVVSRASLQADLLAADARSARLAVQVRRALRGLWLVRELWLRLLKPRRRGLPNPGGPAAAFSEPAHPTVASGPGRTARITDHRPGRPV